MERTVDTTAFPSLIKGGALVQVAVSGWASDGEAGLETRDMGVLGASHGAILGREVRAAGHKVTTRAFANALSPMVVVFVTGGRVTFHVPDGDPIEFGRWDAGCRYGAGVEGEWEFETGASAIAIVAAPSSAAALGDPPGGATWRVTPDRPEYYVVGGRRAGAFYRDFGLNEMTGGRAYCHTGGVQTPLSTGWHTHDNGQFFTIVDGWVDLGRAGHPSVRMHPGDAMCIAMGSAHAVLLTSSDYKAMEFYMPAAHGTVDQAVPADQAALIGAA